ETGGARRTVSPSEPNDTLTQATVTGVLPNGPRQFVANGTLGDNPQIGSGLDVDMFRFELAAGEQVRIDVDSLSIPVDSILRLFNAAGQQLAFSDDDPAPGEAASRDAYLEFTA